MSNCPASELLQQRRIPAFTPPNDAAEAICKLPAKIPSMAASDIQSTYEFRPDEINKPISPLYYTVSQEPVSSGASESGDCVETTDVGSDSFTWVDWLTPITGIEGDRSWILAGESLNCTDNGDLSNSPTFKRPALPITQFGSVLPAPITAPISVASALGGSGGGGGGGGDESGNKAEEVVEVIDNELKIHPIYIDFNQGINSVFEYICGDDAQQLADDRSIKIEKFPVDLGAQEDGTYYIWLYRSGMSLNSDSQAIYSMGFFATTEASFYVHIPSCLFQLVAAVSVNSGKLSIKRIFCSTAQNADVYYGMSAAGGLYEPYGVYFTLSNPNQLITPADIMPTSVYIAQIVLYPINPMGHAYDFYAGASVYTATTTITLDATTSQSSRIIIFLDREKRECVLDTSGSKSATDKDVILSLSRTPNTITGAVSSIVWFGYPFIPSAESASFIIKVYPDYANGSEDSLPFTVRIQQASDTSEYAGRVVEEGATSPTFDQYIPVYEETFTATSSTRTTVYFYINLYVNRDGNNRYCKISKKQTMGSILIGSITYGRRISSNYPNIYVTQSLITQSDSQAVDITPTYIGNFCILSVEETDDKTYGYLVNPGGSTVPRALTYCYVNGYNSAIDTCSPFYFSTTATYGYVIITFVPADLDTSTGAVINNAHILISVRAAGTPPDTADPMNVRSIFMRFNRTATATISLLPLPATPLQFVYAEAPSTTVLEAEIAKHMETP